MSTDIGKIAIKEEQKLLAEIRRQLPFVRKEADAMAEESIRFDSWPRKYKNIYTKLNYIHLMGVVHRRIIVKYHQERDLIERYLSNAGDLQKSNFPFLESERDNFPTDSGET